MKSSDAKASKCHLKFSSKMVIFIKLVYSSSVISLKWQLIGNPHCNSSEIAELKYTSLIKMIILENFKWHLEAFASELFKCLNKLKSLIFMLFPQQVCLHGTDTFSFEALYKETVNSFCTVSMSSREINAVKTVHITRASLILAKGHLQYMSQLKMDISW